MKREDTYEVRVTVNGRNLGTWDKMSGGEVDSEETTYRPGGLRDQVSLGGQRKTGNVTVRKLYDEEVAQGVFHFLSEGAGRYPIVVVKQPLDANGVAFGRPLIYSGKLKAVTPPDADSESNNAALIEAEMTVNGAPA